MKLNHNQPYELGNEQKIENSLMSIKIKKLMEEPTSERKKQPTKQPTNERANERTKGQNNQ